MFRTLRRTENTVVLTLVRAGRYTPYERGTSAKDRRARMSMCRRVESTRDVTS
jgi:hypothetical protein